MHYTPPNPPLPAPPRPTPPATARAPPATQPDRTHLTPLSLVDLRSSSNLTDRRYDADDLASPTVGHSAVVVDPDPVLRVWHSRTRVTWEIHWTWAAIRPHHPLYKLWATYMNILDATYIAIAVPIIIGFGILDTRGWVLVITIIAFVSYSVELVLGFNTGYTVVHGNKAWVVLDRRMIAAHYLRSRFAIDLATIIPLLFELAVYATFTELNQTPSVVQIIKFVRLATVGSIIATIFSYVSGNSVSATDTYIGWLQGPVAQSIQAIYLVFVTVNLGGSFFHWIAVLEGLRLPEHYNHANAHCDVTSNWVCAGNYERQPILEQYVISLYAAVTTLTTVGYGDITPVTVPEILFVMVLELAGVAFFGLILGMIVQRVTAASEENITANERSVFVQKVCRADGQLAAVGRSWPQLAAGAAEGSWPLRNSTRIGTPP